jgi:hypothetical protein
MCVWASAQALSSGAAAATPAVVGALAAAAAHAAAALAEADELDPQQLATITPALIKLGCGVPELKEEEGDWGEDEDGEDAEEYDGVRGRKSEVGSRKSEVGSRKS